jgi:hypothetical protein
MGVVVRKYSRRSSERASRCPWLETVLVMKTAQNRSGHDAVGLANPMAGQHRRDVWAIMNGRSQACVGAPRDCNGRPTPEGCSGGEVRLTESSSPS